MIMNMIEKKREFSHHNKQLELAVQKGKKIICIVQIYLDSK